VTTDQSPEVQDATASPSRTRRWVGIGLVLAVAIGVVLVAGGGGAPTCDEQIPGVRPGICLDDPERRPVASTRTAPVLGDPDRQIGVGDFAGDVLVVNFWASWCGPCWREQPDLNRAHDDLADLGVSFLGVNVQDDSEANALAYVRQFGVPYPSLDDPTASYAASYAGVGPRTMPSTVIIDREGRIAAILLGETGYEEVVTLARLVADED
jgi:thiol-disulfide isomerase/thioredoxin